MPGVENRVAIVTGAGGGIGRAHALLFASHGAHVVVNDLGSTRDGSGESQHSAADAVVAEIRAAGGDAIADYHSVADPGQAAELVNVALTHYGRIDAVVNNAGILRDRSFHKMTLADWEAVRAVHLDGTFYVTHAAWPHLREQRYGRVIVTSSTTGVFGNFGQSNYAACKLGVVGLINALAIEGRKCGITANAVVPIAATRMTEDVMPDEQLRGLNPDYVAPAVVHLASEECTDTGTIILAGGGLYRKIAYFETEGHQFATVPTPSELASKWSEITDLSETSLAAFPEV